MSASKLKIGDIAAATDVTVEAVRYYEQRGLLAKPQRTSGGYRLYDAEAIRRIRFIKRSQQLGFTLSQIKELLALRLRPKAKCADMKDRVELHIEDVEAKLKDLRRLKRALTDFVAACDDDSGIEDCPIVDCLESAESDLRKNSKMREH